MSPLVLCLYAMPLFWVRLSMDSYAIPKLTTAAFLAFLASWGKRIPKTPMDVFFAACGVTLLAATIFSSNLSVSVLGHYRVNTFSLFPLCLVAGLFYISAGSQEPEDSYENLSKHAVYAAVFSSGWALMQLGGSYTPYPLSDGRPYAGMGSTIYLASFLALTVPLALERGMFWQASIITLGIILTETRAGLLAAAVGAGWWWIETFNPSRKQMLAAVLGLSLAGSVMVAWRADIKKADAGRIIVYKTALRIAGQNPLFGYGPDLFLEAFLKNRDKSWEAAGFSKSSAQGTAHNDILQGLACGGIFWTLAYLALCLALGLSFSTVKNNGMLGSGLALFTYAKLNETPLATKIVFFILAGAAIRGLCAKGSGGYLTRFVMGIIAVSYMTISIFDRLLYWGTALGSEKLWKHAMVVMRVFS